MTLPFHTRFTEATLAAQETRKRQRKTPKWQEEIENDLQSVPETDRGQGGRRAAGSQPAPSVPHQVDAEPQGGGIGAHQITAAAAAVRFILGGNATFTLRSTASGTRYTYKVKKAEVDPRYPNSVTWFVSLLSGPDNESDFTYLGIVRDNVFRTTAKSRMNMDSTPVKAFNWSFKNFVQGTTPAQLELWHAGRCGRCGRTLTVPESIASGFGPECINKMEGM
jgi:hypothetical protein